MRARFLASLLALLATGALVSAAAGADEGDATDVGWLCQRAFEDALQSGSADASRFDGAIRSCASVDEWSAAAASFSVAFGETTPLDFFESRCTDPETGLAHYRACEVLPSQAPESTPEPSPEASTARTDRVVIDDATGGLQFDTSDPLYVAVPAGITAHVPGAWKVKYFDVKGKNLKQLDRSIARQSKKVCGDHAWGCVTNRRVAVPQGRTVSNGDRCWVQSISWKPYKPIVWMPRWKTDVLVHQDILRWWTAELARTAAHEAEHIEIDLQYRSWIKDRIVKGRPCGAVTKSFAKLDQKLNKAHRQFHQREDLRERIDWPYIPPGQRQSVKP